MLCNHKFLKLSKWFNSALSATFKMPLSLISYLGKDVTVDPFA